MAVGLDRSSTDSLAPQESRACTPGLVAQLPRRRSSVAGAPRGPARLAIDQPNTRNHGDRKALRPGCAGLRGARQDGPRPRRATTRVPGDHLPVTGATARRQCSRASCMVHNVFDVHERLTPLSWGSRDRGFNSSRPDAGQMANSKLAKPGHVEFRRAIWQGPRCWTRDRHPCGSAASNRTSAALTAAPN